MNPWESLLGGLGALLAALYDVIPSYGVAIILLTITVRLALLPLTIKQTRAMQEVQKIQPEVKRLQAKHKGDKKKLNEETMKLYQEHGVNPLGGCLPMLLQLPVFFALFQVFNRCGKAVAKGQKCPPNMIGIAFLPQESALRAAIVGGSAGFLGMNLALSPTQAYNAGGIFGAAPYALWILLMGASTWYQQKQMSGRHGDAQPPQAQMMARIMPLFLSFISLNFPVALTVYWVASNLWTISQQEVMLRRGERQMEGSPGKAKATEAAGSNGKRGQVNDESGSQQEATGDGKRSESKHKGTGARRRKGKR